MGQYQQTFKGARERTSSSPAGLHYTIWKAMAECDYLAEFQCVIPSLPFIYEFVCKRWLKGIGVIIEKKKGQLYIHTLRLINILKTDFNSVFKYFFAKDLMKAAETKNTLANEQWGAIERIGYLELHEGAYTDCVYAYVDSAEAKLFQGLLNRPVPVHSREFMLAQTDKKLAF